MRKIAMLNGGCDAIHKLGNIGRSNDNYIVIHSEIDSHFIGNFVTGFGFIDVKFKKEDVRQCTNDEKEKALSKRIELGGITYPMVNKKEDFII
jgi:hypothetical protein